MARKRTFKNVFVKQARGGRPSLFGAMPCKEEEGESQLTNEAKAETEPVSGLCLARSKKGEAKIRHKQYPKPNYKH